MAPELLPTEEELDMMYRQISPTQRFLGYFGAYLDDDRDNMSCMFRDSQDETIYEDGCY